MAGGEWRWVLQGLAVLPGLADVAARGSLPAGPRGWLMEVAAGAVTLFLMRRVLRELRALNHQARTDSLTGLLNRRAFMEVLAQECARSDRTSSPLTLVYLDVDRFKSVNDSEGHATGDAVLKRLGTVLNQSLRKAVDRPGRLGGDEFALILPDTPETEARWLLARIERRCRKEEPRFAAGRLGLSAGIAGHLRGGTPEALMLRADQSMYRRKLERGTCGAELPAATGCPSEARC